MTIRDKIARAFEGRIIGCGVTNIVSAEDIADAVLAALPISLDALEALERGEAVVVPVEATEEMWLATEGRMNFTDTFGEVWEEALNASPWRNK